MKPRIAEVIARWLGFAVPIPDYGFMLSLSLLLGIFWVNRRLKRSGVGETARHSLLISALVGVYMGAKSLYIAQYSHHLWPCFHEPLTCLRAGYSLYGGLLGLSVAVLWSARRWGLQSLAVLDSMTPPMALGLTFTRLGCFLTGCNFGRPTGLPWGVRFPAGSLAWSKQVADGLLPLNTPLSLPVHPTQLYESALGIVLCLMALALTSRFTRQGQLFFTMLVAYALFRSAEEWFRADAGGVSFGHFTFAQMVSLILLVTSILWMSRPHWAPNQV
jgi:phosphatidylglycerol---prolipoprotein diacylglyceryl transferase